MGSDLTYIEENKMLSPVLVVIKRQLAEAKGRQEGRVLGSL